MQLHYRLALAEGAWRQAVVAAATQPGSRLADLFVVDVTLAGAAPRDLLAALWPESATGDSSPLWLAALVARDPQLGVEAALTAYWTPLDPAQPTYLALTPDVPAAHWYERVNHDLAGVVARGRPQPWPLVFEADWPAGLYPLRGAYDADAATRLTAASATREHWGRWRQPEVQGEGIFALPFGPVRSGVVEAAQYTIFTGGEDMQRVVVQPFYKHRGIERRFTGLRLDDAVIQAERVAGAHTVAYGLAWCQAVEDALGLVVPERARQGRVILAEMERLANYCGVAMALCETAALSVGQAQFGMLKERVHRLLAALTGSRFARGALAVGGLRDEWRIFDATTLLPSLAALEHQFYRARDQLLRTASFLDRLVGTGKLESVTARIFAALGPVARGSDIGRDVRVALPYAAYAASGLEAAVVEHDGDAQARLLVRLREVPESLRIIRALAARLAPGPVGVAVPPPPRGYQRVGIGWAEAAEGEVLAVTWLGEAGGAWRVQRGHLRPAGFVNWSLFDQTIPGNNQTDFAFIEQSFAASLAGCDR